MGPAPRLVSSLCTLPREAIRLRTIFGHLAAWGGDHGGADILAEPTRSAAIRSRYAQRFGGRERVGPAWRTPNVRSGRYRNIPLHRLRAFVSSHPETVFLSLQPRVDESARDIAVVAAQNLVLDDSIDPIRSIDDQLAQIACLDGVVGIDCSALHFAGALGIPGQVVLGRDPTWQWSLGASFYPSIQTVARLEDVALWRPVLSGCALARRKHVLLGGVGLEHRDILVDATLSFGGKSVRQMRRCLPCTGTASP